jgi:hypothetical protein
VAHVDRDPAARLDAVEQPAVARELAEHGDAAVEHRLDAHSDPRGASSGSRVRCRVVATEREI